MEQADLAETLLDQIKKVIPSAQYKLEGTEIVFILPKGNLKFPVKVINGRFYTKDQSFEKYISEDRKSINYQPYSEVFENLKIDL